MKEQVLSDKQRRDSHHLNDFHLADSYTCIFGVPIIVCVTQAFFWEESELTTFAPY